MSTRLIGGRVTLDKDQIVWLAILATVAMYITVNGKYANRGPVFASEPGEAS